MKNFELVYQKAAGIDIGSEKIFVSPDGNVVKVFDTYTESLGQCAKYLNELGILSIAMEATGVYWIVLYDILEKAGLRCLASKRSGGKKFARKKKRCKRLPVDTAIT